MEICLNCQSIGGLLVATEGYFVCVFAYQSPLAGPNDTTLSGKTSVTLISSSSHDKRIHLPGEVLHFRIKYQVLFRLSLSVVIAVGVVGWLVGWFHYHHNIILLIRGR